MKMWSLLNAKIVIMFVEDLIILQDILEVFMKIWDFHVIIVSTRQPENSI